MIIKDAIGKIIKTVTGSTLKEQNVINPEKVILLGDSTMNQVAVNMINLHKYNVTDMTLYGGVISNADSSWNALTPTQKSSYDFIIVQYGLNDCRYSEFGDPSTVVISHYQNFINDLSTGKKSTCKIVVSTMTPAKAHEDANWYSIWKALNTAIQGQGTTPILGTQIVNTNNTSMLNDGADNLVAPYDSGDHIHPNASGCSVITQNYVQIIDSN